jgi:hypothetical protein
MGIISDKIKALQQFKNGMFNNIRLIVDQYDYILIDMNVQDQLYERGINRNGTALSDENPYRPMTVEFKIAKRQPYDRVTLRDEGDFHSSFKIDARHNDFEIYATDIKTLILAEKYGNEIFGLTNDNLNEFIREYLYPELQEQLIKSLSI